jgi:hypothetical protein
VVSIATELTPPGSLRGSQREQRHRLAIAALQPVAEVPGGVLLASSEISMLR